MKVLTASGDVVKNEGPENPFADRHVAQMDDPAGRFQGPIDSPQQRALSRAIGADKGNNLSFLKPGIDIIQYYQLPESF